MSPAPAPCPRRMPTSHRPAIHRVTAVLGLLGVAVLLVTAGCTTDDIARPAATTQATIDPLAQAARQEQADPVPTLPVPPGFVPADTRNAELPVSSPLPVALPPIPVFGGKAKLTGVVYGPDGPVDGAVVRLERFVGARGGFAEIRTAKDGRWLADGVYGGRFRFRAYQRPNLATTEPQVAFVAGDADLTVDITVDKHERQRLQAALVLGNMQLDAPIDLRARRDHEEVDENGIVQARPPKEPEEVTLQLDEGMLIVGEDTATTDGDGYVVFNIVCHATGPHRATVRSGDLETTIDLPECEAGRPEDVRPEPRGTTTTVAPSSTTSTTELAISVGDTFSTPYPGAVPAGTYEATADGENCLTRYEENRDGTWVLVDAQGGVLRLTGQGRKFEPRPGTAACRFRRTE